MKPANDGRSWTTEDDWLKCGCGSVEYNIKRDAKTGWHHIVCAKCEADVTMEVL